MDKRCLLLPLLLCIALPAQGWKRDGHRIVAELAARELRPQARAEVSRLLADEAEPSLAGVSSWADEVRAADPKDPRANWHYVDFRGGDCDYLPARDCPGGNCVVGAIQRQFQLLSDRARPDAERRDALKYLVHFVADVHQPLHASPRRDKGGNEVQVSVEGRGTNLHAVWDTDMVTSRGLPPEAYASELAKRPASAAEAIGASGPPVAAWAGESCRLVLDGGIYPDTRKLDDRYLAAHRPLAEARLRLAGMRLAGMLNAALAPMPAR